MFLNTEPTYVSSAKVEREMRFLRRVKPADLLAIAGSRDIHSLFLAILKILVSSAKGTLVTFSSVKIGYILSELLGRSQEGQTVDLDRKTWASIREFVEFLAENGLLRKIKKSSRGIIYGIERNTLFWNVLMYGDVTCVAHVLKRAYALVKLKHVDVPASQICEELLGCISSTGKPVVGTVGNQVQNKKQCLKP